MKVFTLLATTVLATALTGFSALAEDSADVIARVGDSEITATDLAPYLANLSAAQKEALAKDPAAFNQFLRTLIVQRLLLKEATAAKWADQPEVVKALDQMRNNAIAQGYLASNAKVPTDYPTEADIQAAYDANKNILIVPRQFHLAQIFIAAPKDSDKTPAKLAAVEKALKSPSADFAKIATANSDEANSAAKGGEIGWLGEEQLQPDIRKAVTTLKKGAVSAPVRLADGWHILKMLEIKEPYTASLSELHDQIAQRLREEKAKQLAQEYVAQLLKDNPVAINEIAVSQLFKKSAQ
jgi:parvulin-like peptidyl-prolyl isomerase